MRARGSADGHGAAAAALFAVVVVLLLALPPDFAPGLAAVPIAPHLAVDPSSAARETPTLGGSMPVLSGVGGPAGLALSAAQRLGGLLTAGGLPSSAIADSPGELLAAAWASRSSHATASGTPTAGRAPPRGPPAGARVSSPSSTTGTFAGTVLDATDGDPIADASVTPTSSGYCAPSLCPTVQTAANGSFVVGCSAPGGISDDYTLQVTGVAWYMENVTYAVCSAGNRTQVGAIDLERSGSAYGVVRAAGSGIAVADVTVSAVSRDGTSFGDPENVTGANGSFLIAVPPAPSVVDFSPLQGSGYLATFNFTDATPGAGTPPGQPPWLHPLDLGTIYLERETLVQANLYDAITGAPIPSGVYSAIEPCGGASAACEIQGATIHGPNPRVWAPPGPTTFVIDALGYAQTWSPTLTVPTEPAGTVFELPKEWLVPDGQVSEESEVAAPTGGHLPDPAALSPQNESLFVTECSLDGYQQPYLLPGPNLSSASCLFGCVPFGTTNNISAPPLRDAITLVPKPSGVKCPPPPVYYGPPLFTDAFTVNLTAGHTLPGTVWANLSAGDYVAGRVRFVGLGGGSPPCFNVSAVSTDSGYLRLPYAWSSCLSTASENFAPCTTVANFSATAFCLPVPPGDSRIVVTSTNFSSNWTWAYVSRYCCRAPAAGPGYPATLRAATAPGVAEINVTPLFGEVTGWVIGGSSGSGTSVGYFAVDICPSDTSSPIACSTNATVTNDSFTAFDVPEGLDAVTITAADYTPDTVWVNVTAGASVSAGTIPLVPYGTVAGEIVDPNGSGIPTADVQWCRLAVPDDCYGGSGNSLGLGFTSTDGAFNGTVPGGWLPGGTYVVDAFAPGYEIGWEFANVSAGGFVTLPPLTLEPIGTNASRPFDRGPAAPARAATGGPGGVWVTGRLLDSATGAGIALPPSGTLAACPVGGYVCGSFPEGTNTEGFFNGSVIPGLYYLNVSVPGFAPTSVFFNATGTGFVDLGNVSVTADDWVAGRVVLAPWSSVTLSTSGTFGQGYAPPASVRACAANGLDCQVGLTDDTNGSFNISAPPGARATILAASAGGFSPNSTLVDLSGVYTTLSGPAGEIPLEIFGEVGGVILDGDSGPAARASGARWLPLPDATASVTETTPVLAFSTAVTDSYGDWIAFLPARSTRNATGLVAQDTPGYDGASESENLSIVPGTGAVLNLSFTLDHYGWIAARFAIAGTRAPAAAAQVVVTGRDPGLGSLVNLTDTTDLDGFVNLTAPPGANDSLAVSALAVNSTSFAVPMVQAGATTFLNGSSFATLRPEAVDALGQIASTGLELYDGSPPIRSLPSPAVRDGTNGEALADVDVQVASSDPAMPGYASFPSNAGGQFYTLAPIGAADLLEATLPGYVTNVTGLSVAAGSYRAYASFDLTGDTVIAGTAVDRFGGAPVPYATVSLCVLGDALACVLTETNGSGGFWATAPPNVTVVTISAPGFVANSSTVATCADCWVSVGTIQLRPDGGVEGSVRGLPFGNLLEGAIASLCPSDLYDGGPCGLNVTTAATGEFFLPIPPGDYELVVQDGGFNTTALPVDVATGELVDVGTIFLEQFGNASGLVLNGSSGLPVAGASVLACPDWSGGTCAAPATCDAGGAYAFAGAPGPYNLTAYAAGYDVGFGSGTVVEAASAALPPIYLYPNGNNAPLRVTGRVVESADPSEGIAGALVAATSGGTVDFSTLTTGNGSFALDVAFGTYTLIAHKAGLAPSAATLDADRSISGLLFELGPQLYPVAGEVDDGLTGQPVPGVAIEGPVPSNGSLSDLPVLATTGPDGSFALELANGSYALLAVASPASAVRYPDDPFTVELAGTGATVNLSLAPARGRLAVRVLEASTGLPLAGASVLIAGTPDPGYSFRQSFVAGPDGATNVTLYLGDYLVAASAPGFTERQVIVALNGSGASLTLALSASTSAPAVAHGPSLSTADLAAVAVIGAAAVVALLLLRRRRGGLRRLDAGPPLPPERHIAPAEPRAPE